MRYALYFSPPQGSALVKTAASWLGRDAFDRADGLASSSAESEAHASLVAEPRRYGFHATLKAPFSLAEGRSGDDLHVAAQEFARQCTRFEIPELVLGQLGPFFALVPASQVERLQQFAADVVETFEPFRAPLSEADLARRNPQKLTPAQRDHLERWGYPYVMEEFRFHMTLTGPVPEERLPAVREELEARFAEFLGKPLPIDGLAIFVEDERGGPFFVDRWMPLKAVEEV